VLHLQVLATLAREIVRRARYHLHPHRGRQYSEAGQLSEETRDESVGEGDGLGFRAVQASKPWLPPPPPPVEGKQKGEERRLRRIMLRGLRLVETTSLKGPIGPIMHGPIPI
jgi:hypothetical protein